MGYLINLRNTTGAVIAFATVYLAQFQQKPFAKLSNRSKACSPLSQSNTGFGIYYSRAGNKIFKSYTALDKPQKNAAT